ncbi:MAG: hypothetical protein NZ805_01440 [Armatimonadetes bacterium]|nr:hypothetical protein [Armatimonadota bacterium]MDW8027600.1 hypothetical protein [Armatimonadota bacterium]
MALTTKDVLRLIELLQQNEWLREELKRVLLPPNFEAWMKGVDERLMRIESTIGELRGSAKESEYARKAKRFLGRLVKNIREDEEALFEQLDDAEAKGKISAEEITELLRSDLLFFGEVRRGKFSGQSILLICEVSVTVSREDVQRSLERVQIARRAGFWAIPLVTGARWSSAALKKWALSENVLCGENGVLQPSPDTDWEAVERLLTAWKPD